MPLRMRGSLGPGSWLILADPYGPLDLARLFPDVGMRVEHSSEAFGAALTRLERGLAILVTPQAGPADLERVATWRRSDRGGRAVLLSPHEAVAMRILALELGFDDALDLSADPLEIVGRLSIAGRLRPPGGTRPSTIAVGEGVELEPQARVLRKGSATIPLKPREYELLEFLSMHPRQVFSRSDLMRRLWPASVQGVRVVDVHVCWLRSKIEADPERPVHLVTLRGSGYRFDPPT